MPGGPQRSAPFGIFAPKSVNFFESFKNCTNSMISFFASSHPATSLKVVVTLSYAIEPITFITFFLPFSPTLYEGTLLTFFAVLFPILNIPPPLPPKGPPDIALPAPRMAKRRKPINSNVGRNLLHRAL